MGLVANAVRWFVEDLERPPRRARRFWVMVVFGALAAVLGLGGAIGLEAGADPRFVPLGLGIAAMGASELLPRDRMRLVRSLRLGTWGAFGLYAAWILLPPLLVAGVVAQASAVVTLLLAAGYVWLVYRSMDV